MSATRKPSSHDPTAARTADQSTQTAGGLHQTVGQGTSDGERDVAPDTEVEEVLYRNDADLYETPRRYESTEPND